VRIGNPRRPPLPSFKKQSYLIVMAPVTLYGNMNENGRTRWVITGMVNRFY